jgi:preflagellin peptidase FlaK
VPIFYPVITPDFALNTLRVIACLGVLGYACMTDWKSRRAPNELWYILGGLGVLFDLYELWRLNFDQIYIFWLIASVLFIYALVYVIFRVGGFGGADAKALIAIAIVFPVYPELSLAGLSLPLVSNVISPVFALAVLGNALVITLLVPLWIFVNNLRSVQIGELIAHPLAAFTGYKVPVDSLKGKHVRLMHRYDEDKGEVSARAVFKGPEPDDSTINRLKKWATAGKIENNVWVTPKLPFLIPITIGFVAAVLLGDGLMQLVAFVMGVR